MKSTVHFSECFNTFLSVQQLRKIVTQIEMRDGTVEHFPVQFVHDLLAHGLLSLAFRAQGLLYHGRSLVDIARSWIVCDIHHLANDVAA